MGSSSMMGSVDMLALCGVKSCTRKLIGKVVCRNDADVVAGHDRLRRGKADSERSCFL